MEKPFFDVFPTLEMNAELKNLFSVTKVTRVAMTRARDFLKVYLSSEKLIRKKDIYQVENTIREQLFSGVPMTVKIIEKFSLSRQYTPEKLMDAYKDSILLELKEYSIFEFNLFRKADCVFENEDTSASDAGGNSDLRGKRGRADSDPGKDFYRALRDVPEDPCRL